MVWLPFILTESTGPFIKTVASASAAYFTGPRERRYQISRLQEQRRVVTIAEDETAGKRGSEEIQRRRTDAPRYGTR